MPRRTPDRALKRAVAGLSRLHPDDVDAILGVLEPDEKVRVNALMFGFAEQQKSGNAAAPEPEWAYENVSPWLVARLDPEDRRGGRPRREFVLITDASRDALREAAEPFRKQVNPPARRSVALLDQMWRLFASRRA